MNQTRGYFSSNKKLARKFSILFWMEVIFCLAVMTFSFVTRIYQQKLADQQYGNWSVAYYGVLEDELSELKHNPVLEAVGTQRINGTVIQRNGETEKEFGSIGTADPSFFELANLQLKTGRLPEKENEIAIEAKTLDGMGISYETGQTIELTIRKEDPENKNSQDTQEITKTFVLSGVLENYTSYWESPGTLIHFFVQEPVGSDESRVAFIEPKRGYEDALKKVSTEDLLVETNTNRIFSRNPFSSTNIVPTLCVVLALLFVTVLQIELVLVWIWKRKQELRVLRILGVHQKTLILNVLAMLFKAGRIPYLVLIVGLALLIPLQYLLGFVLYLLGLTALVLGAATAMIRQIPLQKEGTKKKKRRTPVTSKVVTVKEASRRFFSQQKWTYRLQIFCLVLLQTGLLYFGGQIVQSILFLNNPDIDYRIEGMPKADPVSHFCTLDPIPDHVLNDLGNWTDVEIRLESRMRHDMKMSWDNIQKSLLYNTEEQRLDPSRHLYVFTAEDGQTELYSSINVIGDSRALELLKKADLEGEVDWEKWKQGKEAIIYLPKMRMVNKDVAYGLSAAVDGTIDDSIQLQDLITLEKDGRQYQVPVTGILRSCSPELFREFNPLFIYGLIMSGDEVDSIELDLKDIRNKVPVEIRLSKLASENKLVFRNFASNNEHTQRIYQTKIILNLFSGLILLSVLLVILQISRIIAKEKANDYLYLFRRVGVSRKTREMLVVHLNRRMLISSVAIEIMITMIYGIFQIRRGGGFSYLTQDLKFAGYVFLIVILLAVFLFGVRRSKKEEI
ncbi:hypothetical protein AAK899_11695 [Erysipelotrichaceae bacterium 51-3]